MLTGIKVTTLIITSLISGNFSKGETVKILKLSVNLEHSEFQNDIGFQLKKEEISLNHQMDLRSHLSPLNSWLQVRIYFPLSHAIFLHISLFAIPGPHPFSISLQLASVFITLVWFLGKFRKMFLQPWFILQLLLP